MLLAAAAFTGLATASNFATAQEATAAETPAANASLLFEGDDTTLLPSHQSAMQSLAELAKGQPVGDIVLESYSNWHGSHEMNVALAEQLVEKVKAALIEMGLRSNRIRAVIYGAEKRLGAAISGSRVAIRLLRPER